LAQVLAGASASADWSQARSISEVPAPAMPRSSAAAAAMVALCSGCLVRADEFIVVSMYESADTSCSTWSSREVIEVQDFCRPHGSDLYIKATCSDTHIERKYFSDPECIEALDSPSPIINALECSSAWSGNIKYECGASYPAATFWVYNDSTCETRDPTTALQVKPLNFCMASATASFEGNTKSKQITCTGSGLITTHWENSDCSGTSWVKTEAAVPIECTDMYYWSGHVKVESGCPVAASATTTPLPSMALAFVSLLPLRWGLADM